MVIPRFALKSNGFGGPAQAAEFLFQGCFSRDSIIEEEFRRVNVKPKTDGNAGRTRKRAWGMFSCGTR
jgi:hypothetical protein